MADQYGFDYADGLDALGDNIITTEDQLRQVALEAIVALREKLSLLQ